MTIDDAIEQAARDLPHGYLISIHVERGAAWVQMNTPHPSELLISTDSESNFPSQIIECVESAIRHEKERQTPNNSVHARREAASRETPS